MQNSSYFRGIVKHDCEYNLLQLIVIMILFLVVLLVADKKCKRRNTDMDADDMKHV